MALRFVVMQTLWLGCVVLTEELTYKNSFSAWSAVEFYELVIVPMQFSDNRFTSGTLLDIHISYTES